MSHAHKNKSNGGFFENIWPKKAGSDSSGSQLSRQHSESNLNEIDVQKDFIDQLDENSLNNKFECMLNDVNLSEERKKPLRLVPPDNKRKMLVMHYRGLIHESKNKYDKPTDYIAYLSIPGLSFSKIYNCLESLRIALTNNPLSWVQEFGTTGLKQILSLLNDYQDNDHCNDVHLEVLRCLRAIMNNTVGLKQMFDQKESLVVVARSLDPSKPSVMLEAVKMLGAVCLIPGNGHEKALEAITVNGELKKKDRFMSIVDGLLVTENNSLNVACLQLINAIVSTPDELEFRMHLRNEMMRCGLIGVLETLKKGADEDLEKHLQIFLEHKEEDYYELINRFNVVRLDLANVDDCFEIIKNFIRNTASEPYFLSILQHLLFIRGDASFRTAYYKLIEECISQIVLHRGGCDPDFHATKRFHIDVQPLIGSLVEKTNIKGKRKLQESLCKFEDTLAMKQETEARLIEVESTVLQLQATPITSDGLTHPSVKPSHLSQNMFEKRPLLPSFNGELSSVPPPPPPPPPPLPPMPPPLPTMPGVAVGLQLLPRMRHDLVMASSFPTSKLQEKLVVLPHGLKQKKKWNVEGLKRANWKTIGPQELSRKSFWLKVQEESLASPDILNGLVDRFSSKPVIKKVEDAFDEGRPLKKIKTLRILDSKAAQNLSILLGGCLKHVSYQDVKRCILRCDFNVLTDNVLEQLINYLPPSDQLKCLAELNTDYSQLTEAEQFSVTISEIKRLMPRLNSMKFQLRFSEMVQDIKPDISAGTAACEEVIQSKRFLKILELVLLIGNYMNSGSRNEGAFGFQISFLPKLSNTKDHENKITLLHYLVDTIEKKFPELLTFSDDLVHIDRAARVSTEVIQKALGVMENNIQNLEIDINNSRQPQSDDDLFPEVMEEFISTAQQQYEILQNMFHKMKDSYRDLAEFFSFNKQNYTSEECFADIKLFKDAFYLAYKENIFIRETENKAKLACKAREKAEKERIERANRKRLLFDIKDGQTQEGVMDSLLEALQSGSIFSRDQLSKRQRPCANGSEKRTRLYNSRTKAGF